MSPVVERAVDEGRNELSEAEAREYLNEQTQKYLGLSLAEFMERAEAGTLPSHPVVAHLVLLTGARPGAC